MRALMKAMRSTTTASQFVLASAGFGWIAGVIALAEHFGFDALKEIMLACARTSWAHTHKYCRMICIMLAILCVGVVAHHFADLYSEVVGCDKWLAHVSAGGLHALFTFTLDFDWED